MRRGARARQQSWRVAAEGSVVTTDNAVTAELAEAGLGLAYVPEIRVADAVRAGRLKIVLEPYAPTVPGFFLYYPSRARSSPALRLFVQTAKAVLRAR